MKRRFWMLLSAAAMLLTVGCATSFSAPGVRAEIARQTGAAPREAFEVYAGPVTMALARHIMGTPAANDSSPSGSRVTSFEIAVYELAPKAGPDARVLDFTLIPVRGWEPSLRFRDGDRLGDGPRENVRQLRRRPRRFPSDSDGAIYARLTGTLSKELAGALGKAIQSGSLTHQARVGVAVEREVNRRAMLPARSIIIVFGPITDPDWIGRIDSIAAETGGEAGADQRGGSSRVSAWGDAVVGRRRRACSTRSSRRR